MPDQYDLGHHGDAETAPGLADFAVNVRGGTPPRWLAERLRRCVDDLAAYPDPTAARAAVARRHGRTVEEVLLTAGAAEAFVLLARALAPRRAVVVHPQFTEPEAALRAAGHRVERVLLDGDFTLDPARVPADADMVMVGNPTNPTSVLHPAASLRGLARPGRVVVVDEAFMDCVPGEPETLGGPAPDGAFPGLVVVRSLTKTWGLAGLRAGYVLAEPDLVVRLGSAQPLWGVSTPALAAIEACCSPEALGEAGAWAIDLDVERKRFAEALSARGLHVVPRPRASFLCVRVPAGRRGRGSEALSGRAPEGGLRDLLRERGLAVRRGDTFPGLGPDWVRIAVRDEATDNMLLEALDDLVL
ncbi:MAG TPA: Rv2231c family pyridoxal phosphate-dependent protein CobC [Actinomadura sp.]|jgi:histidinol-phosphate aminotransferase|nr:Rv2231c family pyridoxal phosphate-dependent protein CobC [Actinomadura sp.]